MSEPGKSMLACELEITALAAGGDGLGRDATGRVTFVPRTAPGDRVRVRIVKATSSFARAELVELVAPSPDRVEPACEYFRVGCNGCQWQHVARPAQLAAKQALVEAALRKLTGLAVERIADPCPPLGWRRRARFHVRGGQVGLFRADSHDVVPVAHCPQLEPALDAALGRAIAAHPADGELELLVGHRGEVAVGNEAVEVEPGLSARADEFAQASAAGNAALIELARAAAGKGPGRMLELYAGAGNFTRAFAADGWDVVPSDSVQPAAPPPGFVHATAAGVLARASGHFDAIVLDPPRAGAKDAIAGIAHRAARVVVYISCDPATLARDAQQLVAAGYRAERAWPVDLMPQTAHVEVVLRMVR